MITTNLPWVGGAGLVGVAADCDHRLNVLLKKQVHMLRRVSRDVDTDFVERLDGHGVDVPSRGGPGTLYFKQLAGNGFQDTLRHVTAAGVPGA